VKITALFFQNLFYRHDAVSNLAADRSSSGRIPSAT
jgi:hypothetical protein